MSAAEPEPATDWQNNYFNYFTEIEEHFQRARGTSLFLLSPLDWALIESWKTGGIPIEAVIRGIDDAFHKWRSGKTRRRQINSVAYCAQAVMKAAERVPSVTRSADQPADSAFPADEIRKHLLRACEAIRARNDDRLSEAAGSLENLADEAEMQRQDLEKVEQRLTVIEERIAAFLRVSNSEDEMFDIRRELDAELKPYRGKMTADQLSVLERRYIDAALFRRANLPRLSLFYLR